MALAKRLSVSLRGFFPSLNRCKDDDYVKNTIDTEQRRYSDWYKRLDEKDKGLCEKTVPRV